MEIIKDICLLEFNNSLLLCFGSYIAPPKDERTITFPITYNANPTITSGFGPVITQSFSYMGVISQITTSSFKFNRIFYADQGGNAHHCWISIGF